MKIAEFATDLTDAQWEFLEPMLPAKKRMGRPPTPLRPVVNAILYIVMGGCQWRLLPAGFPPWKTIHHIFLKWGENNTWSALNDRLRAHTRELEGKGSSPTAASLDSQTVRSDAHGGEVGQDAAKKVKGRKRFLLVDTLGLILDVAVMPANETERDEAKVLLAGALPHYDRLRKLWVDSGYSGKKFADWVERRRPKLDVEEIKRSDDVSGFKVLPRRWVVERTFAWIMGNRRLVRDYKKIERSATYWIYMAMIRLMTRRLAWALEPPPGDWGDGVSWLLSVVWTR